MLKNFCKLFRPGIITCRSYSNCAIGEHQDPHTPLTILANGVRVATEVMPSPITCISMFVEAGPRFETACNNGISHMVEHMAYKGFKGMSQSELESSMQQMGVKLSVRTLRELQIFIAICPSDYAPNIVDIFGKILSDLCINDLMVQTEKNNICLESIDKDMDPKAVIFDYLHQAAFQGTSLGQNVIGPSHTVLKFDANAVCNFIKAQYQPYKICIATAGEVHHEDMVKFTETRLGGMIGDPYCVSDHEPSRFTGSQVMYRDDSMPLAHLVIAVEAPGYCSPEFLPMLIASCMIGSWNRNQGSMSGMPLAEAASVGMFCESYKSFYIPYRDVGLWGIYFVAKKMDVEDILASIQDQWMKLCCIMRKTDLERGKCHARLKLAKRVEGVVNSCIDIGTQVMYTCGRRSLDTLLDDFNKIKLFTVAGVCDKYLYDRCPVVAAVGPLECLPEYNRIRAGMYWLRR